MTMKISIVPVLVALAAPCAVGCAESYVTQPQVPTSETTTTASSTDHVTGAQAKELVKNGARLVDVRTPEEYNSSHIEGAVNVPVDTIANADLGPKDTPIVVYCRTGHRSSRAADALRQRGYVNVHELGPMSNWETAK